VTIVRAPRPQANFTMIRNSVLRDGRVGLRARGLLALILSYPDDWRTDYRTLARAGKDGETAIRTAFKELRDAGYIQQRRWRDPETGRWVSETVVFDVPQQPTSQPAVISHAGPPTPESNRLYEDGHEDYYEDELTCAPAPRGPADDTQTTDDEDPADWRDLDFKLWCSLLGDPPHLLQGGKRYHLRACYDAIRRSTNHGARKKWPGRYFEAMDEIEREDWLADRWRLEIPS
jgi:hypothetical protein